MANKIKIGMIGAGSWANHVHYPSLDALEDVEIKAICDLDEDRLKSTADRYEVEGRYKDYRAMLEKESLDAVYVIMAPIPFGRYEHAEPLIEVVTHCLRTKKDLFVEKPPGTSVEETRKMADEAAENGCRTMVGFNRRFIPVANEAKRIAEEAGMITHCVATYNKDQIAQPRVYGLDHLTADVIHAVDALRWIARGEIRKVASHVDKFYSDTINSFNALVVFENGCIGHLNSCYTGGGRAHMLEMHAKGVSAYVNLPQAIEGQEALILRGNQPYEKAQIIKNKELTRSEEFYRCYGYYQENRHFIDCVKEDKEPENNLADAVKTMELIDKIKESTIYRL